MKPFFTDRQVKKFTLKEKFEYIFKQLNMLVQPVIEKTTERIWEGDKYKTFTFLKCSTYNEKGIPLIKNIELPFTDIGIKVEDGLIEITGEKFCYRFPPDMMPEIWRRLKKKL